MLLSHDLFGGLVSAGPVQGLCISALAGTQGYQDRSFSTGHVHTSIVFSFWAPTSLSCFLKLTDVLQERKNLLVLYQLHNLTGAPCKTMRGFAVSTQAAMPRKTTILSIIHPPTASHIK